jgi:hypothetical protein
MRRKPNLKHGRLLAVEGDDYLPALIHAVENLDHSVLAVQGPPGSGKTYLGSRTIAHLVAQGKRIGVVANSHSAVENLLAGCIEAGISGDQIAKQKKKEDSGMKPWTTPSAYPTGEPNSRVVMSSAAPPGRSAQARFSSKTSTTSSLMRRHSSHWSTPLQSVRVPKTWCC